MCRLELKDGSAISTWKDWPTARLKEGRSAKELAKHWTRTLGTVPSDVQELLGGKFTNLLIARAVPEQGTPLPPNGSNGSRMHDLWLQGTVDGEGITICVEAKADESYDTEIATVRKNALDAKSQSKKLQRLELLQKMIWPSTLPENIGTLRYQLLTAVTGTAIQAVADNSKHAVLLVHTFDTSETTALKRSQNDRDFYAFFDTVKLRKYRSSQSTRAGYFLGRVEVVVPSDVSPRKREQTMVVHIAKLCTHI